MACDFFFPLGCLNYVDRNSARSLCVSELISLIVIVFIIEFRFAEETKGKQKEKLFDFFDHHVFTQKENKNDSTLLKIRVFACAIYVFWF